MKKLSPTMKRAVEVARASGGYLDRHEAGWLWSGREGWMVGELHVKRFSDRTIQVLVERGLAKYTAWERQGFPCGPPIEVTLTPKAAEV